MQGIYSLSALAYDRCRLPPIGKPDSKYHNTSVRDDSEKSQDGSGWMPGKKRKDATRTLGDDQPVTGM